ncbi:phosphotriesterase family protein [Streptomyces nanshensis]|nr:phosphotriesterase-related protein [Streptomyces nanshensis]
MTGPVAASELGMTLAHEHLFTDNRRRCREPDPDDAEGVEIAGSPLRPAYLARLRFDPMLSRDNAVLDDADLAVTEALRFRAVGGRTIVNQTPLDCGRREGDLRQVAERTGLNVVAGAGYYLEAFHPPWLRGATLDEIADSIVREVEEGTDGVRAGILGETGVSADFTDEERRVLRASGRAQRRTGLPLSVHLPGWERYGTEVLDVLEAEGCDPAAVVLSHLNPSAGDVAYHRALAARGAWLSFDMIGIDWWFGHQNTQAPADSVVASAVAGLIGEGLGARILISCDTYLKMQLHAFGGYGYDHLPLRFLPALVREGVAPERAAALLTDNPRDLFVTAARNGAAGRRS